MQGVALRVAALDASGDPRVGALLDEYAGLLTWRRSGPDGGQAEAIGEGWANLGGDVLGWLNADDFLYPGALKAAEAALQASGADAVTGDSIFLDGEGRFFGYHPGVGPPDARILTSNPISQPSTFVRRAAVEAAGGIDGRLHYTMDWDLWVRLFRNGARFVRDGAVLSGVTIEKGTKTMGFGRRRRAEVLRIIAPHAGPVRKAKVVFGMALQYADDRTGLVSRALDLAGSRREGGGEDGRIIAQRGFREPASLAVTRYAADMTGCVSVACDGIPLRVEWSVPGEPVLVWDWPGQQLSADFPAGLASGKVGVLRIFPASQRNSRLLSVVLKN